MSSEKVTGFPKICIILATYNGADYLGCQIESIRKQTYEHWELLIRDDGSADPTTTIIERFCNIDNRIRRIEFLDTNHLGPKDNFGKLLSAALQHPSELFYLCDQDDYWYPTKIQSILNQAEKTSRPCLFFSKLELVDSNLSSLSEKNASEGVLSNSKKSSLSNFLSLNHIPGCCMAFNRGLAELANPIPDTAIMHDWWIALVAASYGELQYIDESLVKYRQHSRNTIGAISFTQLIFRVKAWPALWKKGSQELCQSMQQAGELAKRFEDVEPENQESTKTLKQYANIPASSLYPRLKTANKLGLRKGRGILRLVLYLRLLFLNCNKTN